MRNKIHLYLLVLIAMTVSSACSYTSEKAVLNGDVVNMHGPIYNYPVFESFLESMEMKEAATVRIANYTLEGDLTLYNISSEGSTINLEIDRSKHKSRGNDPVKVNMTCTDLIEEEGQQLFVYTLKECDSSVESFTILSVAKEHVEEHAH
ncbi:DUF4362 domain-containing protein [Sporosarcina sp. E16_8]|uniref:DUF4362 domain-containing protein n=1 Tax=Sporosarcina sp. E16_8 TaxID=2789295 RepID=UPI001A91BAF0|nr:DUF4362 domain-containing protein [Sporosarcina sp. E16_8]MBO0586892.1 DUF4362 domain-containing protein [Sporosarcina sp. E16_8]